MSNTTDKIVIVIVLYKTHLNESKTFQTFINQSNKLKYDYDLLIYNNSQEILIVPSKSFTLVNADKNNKLIGAYNMALTMAMKSRAKWLLLLDQDTEVTAEYFERLSDYLNQSKQDERVVAVVPFLEENNKQLSPHKLVFFNNMAIKIAKAGLQHNNTNALNTLTLLRTKFIYEIGGFSAKYPLDMLDYWVYSQIQKNNKKVYVLDTSIKHNLSVSEFEKNMSLSRYNDLILAEKELMLELGFMFSMVFRLKLLLRFLKQILIYKNKEFAFLTFKNILK